MSKRDATPRRTRVESGIYRRADDSYEIGFRCAQGKQRWRKVDGGIRAARAALAQAHAQRARNERVADNPRLTFSEAADAWWEARVVKMRPATRNAYGAGLSHLRTYFGRVRLSDIGPADVARYVAHQQKAGLKGWTIKGHLTVLSSVCTYSARHLGLVGVNPVSLLDSIERPSTADEKPKRILNGDELRALLEAVPENYSELFHLAAETGGRLGEVLGLTWADIDLEAQTVTFTHQLDRARKRVALKTTRSRRCLEVTPYLTDRLRKLKMASEFSADQDLVFSTLKGRGLDHRNIGGRVLARAAKDAGLGAIEDAGGNVIQPAPTFHALRHSHASALIAAGWDIAEVSARMGHASIATTQRVYVHQFDAARRSDERRDRLAKLYGNASSVEALVEATEGSDAQQTDTLRGGEVLILTGGVEESQQVAAA